MALSSLYIMENKMENKRVWVSNTGKATTHVTHVYNGPRNDARRADEKIKYCCECARCWALNEFSVPVKYEPEYYIDFPSYGKQILMCPNCE